MNITSEDAVSSLISDEIENESLTEATASARTIVIPVDSEMALTNPPDEGEAVREEPLVPSETPTPEEPGPDEPDSGGQK